ncbi:R3H domain-containing protein 2 isoform X2 [Zerene cesonia]|uniref:R3H domain-containing protein 2 isoform X2 n=1 Tax=Zerene cesonia TaxID=33412 RepID=UPI0018E55B53|nr:R3H domain-containing protein 2 isoform X2 [Zerene cesonia]
MENTDVEKNCSSEDGQLTRNRSFKSKQLVRSQAIRESASPPRTASPYPPSPEAAESEGEGEGGRTARCATSVICDEEKLPVQIQITSGGWEVDNYTEQRLRTRRWLGQRPHSDSSRDFLSYNPRVTCVCGKCACPHCRGKRKNICAMKQDSGIVCSVDCPDCSDCENIGTNGKTESVDIDENIFYCRCPERKEKPKSLSLSGNDSDEKSELSDHELVNFIRDTLNKNPKDRITLLKVERELHALVNDVGRCIVRFPVMTSYGRMLVHRCAALFQLAHHIDHTNKNCVIVSKSGTSGGRIPCTSFKQWCTRAFPKSPPRRHDDTLAKSILKRCGAGALEAGGSGADAPRSKSLEQRERDYERVRRRIFSSDNCTQDENQWPWLSSGPVKLLTPDGGRNKLAKVQSLESRDEGASRGAVAKSHSFGGYEPTQPRLLSRQGDLASSSWRLSPSSSGYKTLSLRSTDSVTPSPTGGASPEPGSEAATLVWAVTDLSAVPPGAIVIHPQTGRPLTNPDGSIYHFDPANPPAFCNNQHSDKNDANDKRRGKLEKQHSFMVTDCECPTSECRKCCCECRQSGQKSVEKTTPQGSKSSSVQSSPAKTRACVDAKDIPVSPEPGHKVESKPVFEVQPQRIESSRQPENSNYEQKFENKTIEIQKSPENKSNRKFETQKSFDGSQFENALPASPANQRQQQTDSPNQRYQNSTNQRPPFENRTYETQHRLSRTQSQEHQQNQEVAYNQNYGQGYRHDELTSPSQAMVSYQPEVAEIQGMMAQAKLTPVPIQDPNMRPVSMANVMYPGLPQGYPFVSHCRIEQGMQPIYQPMVEEPKHLPPSPHTDTTFRIDPSYPYATEFNAYGGCSESVLQQRGYNMGYGQVEVPAMVPSYPVPNVILQPPIQHYPYQEPIQWQNIQQPVAMATPAPKLMLHDIYPIVCPNVYQPYNVVYPQVLPQPYPVCQPVYPLLEKAPEVLQRRSTPQMRKRNSAAGSARETPHERSEGEREPEIANKIQQIKMAIMNTKEKRREEFRGNGGSGILGSYPVHAFNGRVNGRPNDEAQLSSAARAIVNSIRNIQAKNNYTDGRKYHDSRPDRPSDGRYRPRPDDRERVRPADRPERPERRAGYRDNPFAVQYRPPYLLRQMSPGTWCRRSPGPVHPVLNPPRRPHPDRNPRR